MCSYTLFVVVTMEVSLLISNNFYHKNYSNFFNILFVMAC